MVQGKEHAVTSGKYGSCIKDRRASLREWRRLGSEMEQEGNRHRCDEQVGLFMEPEVIWCF